MSKTPEERAREDIDETLSSLGWESLGEYKTEASVGNNATGYIEEYQTRNGPVDYGLIINGDLHSVIEAKKHEANVQGHFQQLKRYVTIVDTPNPVNEDVGAPVGFVGNGDEFCRYDFREYGVNTTTFTSFYTPSELRDLAERDYNAATTYFDDSDPTDVDPDLWGHQQEAVSGVEGMLAKGYPSSLIEITTGAGKTRSAMALSYRLLKSGFADSILYIPDNREIAKQAKTDFSEYDPAGIHGRLGENYVVENLQANEAKRLESANVVVTTLQMMYEVVQSDPSRLSAGKFDVIITDECHRSIYNTDGYGQVLSQIDAVEIGLTATPTEQTINRFNDEKAIEYGYGKALEDGYVVPYDAHEIKTRITMDGVEDEDGEYHPAKELGRTFSVKQTHKKAAREIYERSDEKTELTLVFAATDDHATAIVNDLRETGPYADEDADFIQKITYKADNPGETLQSFKDPYSPPYIAVTVQQIEAGIDIRPLKNIVMLRPVKSKVLFNQMVGRGTRIYGDKEKFRLFDFVGVLEYHKGLPPFATEEEPGSDVSDSGDIDEDSEEREFIIIDESDEVVLQKEYFQLENIEGKLSGEEYRECFVEDVTKNASEIHDVLLDSKSIPKAIERINDVFHGESGYYVPMHVLQVFNDTYNFDFDSNVPNEVFLLNVINDVLYDYYPDFDERVEYAHDMMVDTYTLNDVEKEYLKGFRDIACPPNGVEMSYIRQPPLSRIGGVKRAQDKFSTIPLEEFIQEFNSFLVNPLE